MNLEAILPIRAVDSKSWAGLKYANSMYVVIILVIKDDNKEY